MILTTEELESLVQVQHRSPHQLLGMHPLGDGSGVVVRALIPDADEVEIIPTHEKSKPSIKLSKIHPTGLFEGISTKARQVYAYDLLIRTGSNQERRTRDPYSFLPSLGEMDLYLFGQGNEHRLYDKLGAQFREMDGVHGVSFALWAPNAQRVSVVGSFNHWDGRYHPMRSLGPSGVWELFIPGIREGDHYKFEIREISGNIALKTDPFAAFCEAPPKNASIVWNTRKHQWTDQEWMESRAKRDLLKSPMSIYEVHLGSWQKKGVFEGPGYRELAAQLIDYLQRMRFTHVEFLPVAEHAFYPSWGYQVTGFYAPSHRYGTPDDFQYLVNELHRAGIGVIVDWVPAHFPRDTWALAQYDGTALYEHEDPRKGAHQDWGTLIFNYGRHEVRNFLTANALFWCDRYHIDGLRVDAVASMLYLDYSRKEGEWIPNQYGGRENLEAVEFLRQANHLVHTQFPGVATIAEESTAWPMVTRPPYIGGLGFNLKWNMGWMHDTLNYFKRNPIHRKFHQNDLTFAMLYHFNENFVLPLSHDEVVHGKGSLLGRMPGDDWQRFANLRTLLAYQWLFPGKKLLFMGCEFGQSAEWNANTALDWWLLGARPYHKGVQQLVADLNNLYLQERGLWESDYDHAGFYWIDCNDSESSTISFVRQLPDGSAALAVILNLTPVLRTNYKIGLPKSGRWQERLNTDSARYGGSNQGNMGAVQATATPHHNQQSSAIITLPPLAILVLKAE
ncbi:MAG: 1,4-alpha-glucan branching protein GlgB [Verrucomicrobiota bacterium]|nr:1,4-alpha-glucan branching protein GlgB [Verrucomicrobiota bacterium]